MYVTYIAVFGAFVKHDLKYSHGNSVSCEQDLQLVVCPSSAKYSVDVSVSGQLRRSSAFTHWESSP